jgi:hypothetical protein
MEPDERARPAPRYDDDRQETTRHPPALAAALAHIAERLEALEVMVLELRGRVGAIEDRERRSEAP